MKPRIDYQISKFNIGFSPCGVPSPRRNRSRAQSIARRRGEGTPHGAENSGVQNPESRSYHAKPYLWFALAIAMSLRVGFAADVEFKLVTLKTVSEPREITVFRDELLLGSDPIDRITVTDLLNDGFDENDFIQIYPSGRVIKLQRIAPRLDSLLRSYKLPPNVEIHESKSFFTKFDSTSRVSYGGQALGYGLMGGIAERLYRGYKGNTVEGYFRYSPSGFALQAWNFDSTKVKFPPPDPLRFDTFFVYIHDTIKVPEVVTVAAEPIIIRDTVYIPSELVNRPRGLFHRVALGMIGGGYDGGLREVSRGKLFIGAGNEWDFGVWDPWISGRQDVDSRIGLRFVAEMAPWKSDTLSPRFLSGSFEWMWIPAWDGRYFFFAGARGHFDDDPWWDRARAAWDEDRFEEPSAQDLSQYELTVKAGLDKLSAVGSGKRIGLWLKVSGFVPTSKSGYDLTPSDLYPMHWEHTGGYEGEGAMTLRLGEWGQIALSVGDVTITNLSYVRQQDTQPGGLFRASQFYQTAALRLTPVNSQSTRIRMELSFRNNILEEKAKGGNANAELPLRSYFETPEVAGVLGFDLDFLTIDAGAKYYAPPDGFDAQVRPFGSLSFMIR